MANMNTTTTPSVARLHDSMTGPADPFASVGYTFFTNTTTTESRHDRRVSAESAPPAYAEDDALPPPSYSVKDEPMTLARYMFKFGFLFPPFWVMGAIILCSPLSAPPADAAGEWLPDKTDAEKQQVISRIRQAELKWSRRCLWATLVFALLAIIAAVVTWAVLRA